ncbi:MAG: hypothetical protein J3Q66DRAFT_362772 [Benniella sp.]|nr:MAG: hypothetical protein J3Q66DRAFT_362772 [Benniella sp.]
MPPKRSYNPRQMHQKWIRTELENGGSKPSVRKFAEAFPAQDDDGFRDYGRLLIPDIIQDEKTLQVLKHEFDTAKSAAKKAKKTDKTEVFEISLEVDFQLYSDNDGDDEDAERGDEDEEQGDDNEEEIGVSTVDDPEDCVDTEWTESKAGSPFEPLISLLYSLKSDPSGEQQHLDDSHEQGLEGTIKELYQFAKDNLLGWADLHPVDRKTTLVALSGVVFTIDQSMSHFTDFELVRKACFDETLMTPTEETKNLAEELTGVMNLEDDEKNLRALDDYCSSERLKVANFTPRRRLLNLVLILCLKLELQAWSNTSEAAAVAIWEEVFRALLPSTMRTLTGETGLVESKVDRRSAEEAHANNNYNVRGRRVDLLIQTILDPGSAKETGPSQNVVVFEAKRSGKTSDEIDIQTRKCVRLNKSLVGTHRGLDIKGKEPLILDIHGCRAMVYTIKRMDTFYGAGKVTDKYLELPDTSARMKSFLESGTLGALVKIAGRLEELNRAIQMTSTQEPHCKEFTQGDS